jgi:hypothetical protein
LFIQLLSFNHNETFITSLVTLFFFLSYLFGLFNRVFIFTQIDHKPGPQRQDSQQHSDREVYYLHHSPTYHREYHNDPHNVRDIGGVDLLLDGVVEIGNHVEHQETEMVNVVYQDDQSPHHSLPYRQN